jgi:hypothetical protein
MSFEGMNMNAGTTTATTTALPAEIKRPRQRYKLLVGIHSGPNPNADQLDFNNPNRHTIYKAGDIVDSEEDLVAKFVNKFELAIPGVNAPIVVTEERRKAVAGLIELQLWSEEDRTFLETLPDEGFNRIVRNSSKAVTEPVQQGQSNINPGSASPLGDDCTDRFQQAYDHQFKVYRTPAGKYQVHRKDPTGTTKSDKPLNKQPLEQSEVEPFVAKLLK